VGTSDDESGRGIHTDSSGLHDELDRADEETEELENEVLLLLLHLVETILPATLDDLFRCETNSGVGLEHVLRDNTTTAGLDFLFLFKL
jgi:hypothetical protein